MLGKIIRVTKDASNRGCICSAGRTKTKISLVLQQCSYDKYHVLSILQDLGGKYSLLLGLPLFLVGTIYQSEFSHLAWRNLQIILEVTHLAWFIGFNTDHIHYNFVEWLFVFKVERYTDLCLTVRHRRKWCRWSCSKSSTCRRPRCTQLSTKYMHSCFIQLHACFDGSVQAASF